MREILFRGKRIDNGEWVYGNVLGDSTIIPTMQEFEIEACRIFGCNLTAYEVDPSTIGQFIGLTDKHGKPVYENDVISDDRYSVPMQIKWNDEEAAFELLYCDTWYGLMSLPVQMRLMGNAHDNPDLLQT